MDKQSDKKLTWKEAILEAGRFTFCEGVDIEKNEETRGVTRDTFQLIKLNGKLTLKHAFILYAVNSLGHATEEMVSIFLRKMRMCFPEKEVPKLSTKQLLDHLDWLSRSGMLMKCDYIYNDMHVPGQKGVFNYYTCTHYGHVFFKNMLDMTYASYDENAMFHAAVETFKRLTAGTVALNIALKKECTGYAVNGRTQLGEQRKTKGYIYSMVEFGQGESRVLYMIEPIFFHVDSRVTTEKERDDRIVNRMQRFEEIVAAARADFKMKIVPIVCVEEYKGIQRVMDIAKKRARADFYEQALFTSENLMRAVDYKLDSAFLRIINQKTAAGNKYGVVTAGDKWMQDF